jgi:hypothetical protein
MSTARRPLVERGDVQLGLRISTSAWLDVAGGDVGRAAHVEAQRDGLVAVAREHEVLEVEDDVGDVLGDTGMVSNSWRASSKRTWVMAAPGIDDSSVRRSELPSVWPKPGSSGPTAKRCRLPPARRRLDGGALDDQHGSPRDSVRGGGDYLE